MPYIALSFF
ncbi:uncharacterized protein FFFS_12827 [Fusarium fujikuroi]|nr:uncharacterized protein FFFS_12827 [Fusarium fujikuroi]